jgi:hypothetical protein
MELRPWLFNTCWPQANHWLLYTTRSHYVARVDGQKDGRWMWRVFGNMVGDDRVGWCSTLEDAQREAERVLLEPVEKPLQVGQLQLF